MSSRSERLAQALDFLQQYGYATSQRQIARTIGVQPTTLNMAAHGQREPNTDMLLRLCDYYPVNFQWLRSGTGEMVDERIAVLCKRISKLESILRANGLPLDD